MKKQPADGIDILEKFNPGEGAQSFVFGDSAKFVPGRFGLSVRDSRH